VHHLEQFRFSFHEFWESSVTASNSPVANAPRRGASAFKEECVIKFVMTLPQAPG
jgi:hypothetical protein